VLVVDVSVDVVLVDMVVVDVVVVVVGAVVEVEPTVVLVVLAGVGPETSAVGADVAVAEPFLLVATTVTAMLAPTSLVPGTYVSPEAICEQSPPVALHRFHWYV